MFVNVNERYNIEAEDTLIYIVSAMNPGISTCSETFGKKLGITLT